MPLITTYLKSQSGHQLAISHHTGTGPGILFCGGFHSNMNGCKATFLQQCCTERGWGYTRFDYRGHGESEGAPELFTIHDWLADTLQVMDWLDQNSTILVGSSMGGWIATLAALARPAQFVGLLGIAAAPDFTSELIWSSLNAVDRETIESGKVLYMKSNYEQSRYPITKALIDSGRQLSVLSRCLPIQCPIRLLHGTADTDVPDSLSIRLLNRIESTDARLVLIKGADHRFSDSTQLRIIDETLKDLRQRVVCA